MDLGRFFIYSEIIKEKGLQIGFELYEAGHLLWIGAVAAAGTAAAVIYKKAAVGTRNKTKKLFAVMLLISEILKDLMLAVQGANMMEYLPLHLCSFTILVMLIHSRGRWEETAGQFFAYALFPGAAAALLFCNWTEYPFISYMNIHSFWFHGWIVIYFAMIYHAGEVRPSYKGLWKTVGAMMLVSVPVYVFNLIFGTNYLFLNEASEGSPLVIVWELFGESFGAPGYLAGVVLMVIVIFHALYVVYELIDRIFKKKRGFCNGNKGERKKAA